MKKLFNSIPLSKTANWLLLSGFIITLTSVCLFLYKQNYSLGLSINSATFGDLGSFLSGTVGSLWSLASVIYFIVALKEQRKDIAENQRSQALQRFESTFFNLINLHTNTVNELHTNEDFGGTGNQVFVVWKFHLDTLAINNNVKYEYSPSGGTIRIEGNGITDHNVFDEYLANHYYSRHYIKFENALNHYFRQLYHVYKYIYQSELITHIDKKRYAGILRAQLSQNELYAIAVNAIIPNYGYPKFMFLIKEFNVLKNFNPEKIPEGILWQHINKLKDECTNPFNNNGNS